MTLLERFTSACLTLFILLSPFALFSQGGPGGVGNSNQMWLDASQTSYQDGDAVSSWSDQSGNGNSVSSSGSNQPTFNGSSSGFNGKPTLSFDGSDDYLQSGSIAALETNNISYFMAIKEKTGENSYRYLIGNNYNDGSISNSESLWGSYYGYDTQKLYFRNSSGDAEFVNTSQSNSPYVLGSQWDGSNIEKYEDGALTGSKSCNNSNPQNHQYTRIGAYSDGTKLFHDGKIAEVIIYNKTLSNAERNIVNNYLASKYGFSMGGNSKYAHKSSFGEHIAGIAKEGDSVTNARGTSLMQMKSAGDLNSGEYQLWGDDGNDTTWIDNDPFSNGDSRRINRIWRNDETGGDPGSVDLVFHIGNNTYGDNTKYELLVDTDTDFSDATKKMTGTYSSNSNTVTFSGVNLSDDVHFTIGNPGNGDISSTSDGNWNDAGTWDCSCVPTKNNKVTVLNNVTVAANGESGKLILSSFGSLSFSGSDTLSVHGDYRMEQEMSVSNGVFAFRADSSQLINLNGSHSPTFNGLHVDNASSSGVSFSNASSQTVTIKNTGAVTFADGDLDVSGASDFILKSTSATNTARIGQIPSGSDLAGNVTLERQIDAGNGNAGYIDVASPLSGVTVEQMDTELEMSGKTSGNFSDGCAWSSNGCFYSVKKHDTGTNNGSVQDVTNTNETMDRLKGFELYIGSNTSDWTDVNGGVANPGSLSKSFAGNWAFTGNPYCSDLDWDKVYNDNSGVASTYWVAAATGNYESYDASTGNVSNSVVNADGTISPFQAIWVESTGASSFSIDQSHKVSTGDGFMKSEPTLYSENMFGLNMHSKMNDFSCRSKVRFHASASRKDDPALDSRHRSAPVKEAPELAFLSKDDEELRRQSVPSFDEEVTLPVLAKTPVKGTYTLDAEHLSSIDQYDCVKLVDLKTRKTYDLRKEGSIQFDVTEKENDDPRFNLVLSKNGSCKASTSVEDEKASGPIVNITQDAEGANVRVDLEQKQQVRMKLYDMTGRPVRGTKSFTAKNTTERISAPETSGVYMIIVETENDRVTKRVKF